MEVLVVMATGMGKSLLFQLPSCLPGAGTTVLIVPLVVLRLDLIRRCHEMGIDCQDWSTNHHSQAALVVFLSVEAAVSEEGRAYLYPLHHAKRLTRIVVDECHLILTTDSYRRSMGQHGLLRSIPVQFVYLTATLPPSMRDTLLKRHHLTQILEIRASTRRSNLKYTVQHLCSDQHAVVEAAALMRQLWQEHYGTQHGRHRALLFTRTKADADRLAGLLGCMSYHSEAGTVEDKARTIKAWVFGTSSPFLVGTSGLGAGFDYPSVRIVIHVDEPHGLMEFAQESGRGGRDGEAAETMVVLRYRWRPRVQQENEQNEKELHQFLCSSSHCRRTFIDRFFGRC